MTTTIKFYLGFVIFAALIMVGLMFTLNPEMIIPSLIGVALFILIIYFFFKKVSPQKETVQRKIAHKSYIFGEIAVVIFLVAFFIIAAKKFNIPLSEFLQLWFGF